MVVRSRQPRPDVVPRRRHHQRAVSITEHAVDVLGRTAQRHNQLVGGCPVKRGRATPIGRHRQHLVRLHVHGNGLRLRQRLWFVRLRLRLRLRHVGGMEHDVALRPVSPNHTLALHQTNREVEVCSEGNRQLSNQNQLGVGRVRVRPPHEAVVIKASSLHIGPG